MNHQLERELIDSLPQPSTQSHSISQSSSHTIQHLDINPHFVKIKLYALITMMAVFLFYRLGWQPQLKECISDLTHQWTVLLNNLLNNNELFYQIFIIIAQQSIQINIICLCIICTWKVRNLQGHLFLTIFFIIRAIFINLEKFPYPLHYRWDAPIVPSLTVPYGVTRDYFYSGHTGVMLFSTIWWRKLGYKWLFILNVAMTPFVILVLLSTRVHYSIDVIAAAIVTLWLNVNILRYVVYFDKLWTSIIEIFQKIYSRLKAFFQ